MLKSKRILVAVIAALMALSALLGGCNTLSGGLVPKPTVAKGTDAPTREPASPSPAEATATPAPSADEQGTITTGQLDGNAYSNKYFGLTLTLPEGWSIATKEEMAQIYQAGLEYLGTMSEDAAKKAKLAEQKSIYAFYVSKHPLNYTGGTNPNIQLMFENLGLAGMLVPTGKEYCEALIAQFQNAQMPYTFDDITEITFGGQQFFELPATFNLNGIEGTQRYFCTVMKGYALSFIVTSFSEDDAAEFDAILQSISFQ